MSIWAGIFGYGSDNQGGRELPVKFGTEPIVGYRTWRVRRFDGLGFRLCSLIQSYAWLEENTAQCLIHSTMKTHQTPAPDPNCACGFYILKYTAETDKYESHVRGRVRAHGEVALTGRLIVCQAGYKAQFAQILSPVFVDVDCKKQECMNPVRHLRPTSQEEFWGLCDDHDEENSIPAGPTLTGVLEGLAADYPNTEFLSFHDLK